MASTSQLAPTFYGYIPSTRDALLLFEACLRGNLTPVARRPPDRERVGLIKSGNVFIYGGNSSDIIRWTDGVPWSPSRLLGNFLIYRELDILVPIGEKRRAIKRNKSSGISKEERYRSPSGGFNNGHSAPSAVRSLIGSLINSYEFKKDGLMKKTIGVTVGGVSLCLVSYYAVADVLHEKFITPSKDPRFQHITLRRGLTEHPFRSPIDEANPLNPEGRTDQSISHRPPTSRFYNNFDMSTECELFSLPSHNGYNMANRRIFQRPTLSPMLHCTNPPTSGSYSNFGITTGFESYHGLPTGHPNANYRQQYPYGSEIISNHVQHQFMVCAGPTATSRTEAVVVKTPYDHSYTVLPYAPHDANSQAPPLDTVTGHSSRNEPLPVCQTIFTMAIRPENHSRTPLQPCPKQEHPAP